MQRLRVVVAPSGYKECLDADEVAAAIAEGVRAAAPDADVVELPLVDGGEGFAVALARATGGEVHEVRVTGPVGDPVEACFGLLGGADDEPTAVLEMAAAAGLRLVPRDRRDPLVTTTWGVGELIRAALDAGAKRILVGCGDSGTNDGGAGMAQALGARLLKADGTPIGRGGAALLELDRIDLSGLDPRVRGTPIDVACNIHNLLCGERGVARVFGPQKGASPETVARLEEALERYAAAIARDVGPDVRTMPGAGASGGLGAGLHALLGATLHQRYDIVMRYLDIESRLDEADLVLTAEGGIDEQTPRGKIPAEVGGRARRRGVPVIALAGTVGKGAEVNHEAGIDAFFSTVDRPCTLEEAIADARRQVRGCAENVMRAVLVGVRLASGGDRTGRAG